MAALVAAAWAGTANADVSVTADGQTSRRVPVDVLVDTPVSLTAEVTNCSGWSGWEWQEQWDLDGDGTWDITTDLPTSPCNLSPRTQTYTYASVGVTTVTYRASYCTDFFGTQFCGTDEGTVEVNVGYTTGSRRDPVFVIGAPTAASTCEPATVTITVYERRGRSGRLDIDTDFDGTIAISTTSGHGDWTGDGTVNTVDNGAADDGAATYTFDRDDDGVISLGLTNVHADDLRVRITEVASETASISDIISFRDNAFVISTADPLDAVAVAARPHAMQVDMVRRDPASGDCGVAAGYAGSKDLKAWLTPDTLHPAGAAAPAIGGVALPSSASGADNVSLTFTAGSAQFPLDSSDVGRFVLNLRDDSRSFASGVDIGGSSATLTVRPFALRIGLVSPLGHGVTASGAADPNVFAAAGQDFAATLTAVAWQSADDADDDGRPDAGADLTDNLLTGSFGEEGTPEAVDLGHTLVAPGTGRAGNLLQADGSPATVIGGFASGERELQLQWDEVGIVSLSANLADGDYLGSGVDVTGTLENVGRFRPDHFALDFNAPALRAACGAFTYIGQAFRFAAAPVATIEARSAAGARTENYEGDFWRLGAEIRDGAGAPAAPSRFGYTSNVAGTALAGTPADVPYPDVSDTSGRVVVTLHAGEDFSYLRPPTPLAPFDADLRLAIELDDRDDPVSGSGATGAAAVAHIGFEADTLDDPDGVPDSGDEGFNALSNDRLLRYGRVRLINSYGPETRPLALPVRAEFFDGTGFVPNADDGCTTLAVGDFSLSNELQTGETDGTIEITPGVVTTMSLLDGDPAAPGDQLTAGDAGASFSAPGAGNAGYVDVDLDLAGRLWLQFDWNGDGAAESPPRARATFGIYRGSDRMIYIREVY